MNTAKFGAARRHVARCIVVLLALGLATRRGDGQDSPSVSPLSPQQALASFEVHPGLQVELVASEPQVVDPVAMAFDERGRLWVAEMSDYPFGPRESESPRSRIKVLEDLDGDGFFETAHLFADGLLFATGVQPWRGGVIVTLSGELAWLADTDGDLRADVHETWFRGFAEKNPQLRANDPTLWYDGRVYVAGGLFYGGKIVAVHEAWRNEHGNEPIDLGSRDFRFDPRTGQAERIAGGAQFGLAFDVYGNRFVCSNSRPLEHVVLEEHFLDRNRHARMTKTNDLIVPSGEARPLFPLSRQETTSYRHEGQFTAACGAVIYGGDALAATFLGNAFVCEPTASLVHREVLRPDGVSFAAAPGREGEEFLASRDSWFRPVFLGEGPDGALYVVDMYRAVIEHPDWFPDLADRKDLSDGNDRGRIWRVTDERATRRSLPTRRLAALRSSAEHGNGSAPAGHAGELIALLDHANAWHRMTAARLLYEQPESADPRLVRETLRNGATPAGRIAALHILAGIGKLTGDDLIAAIASGDVLERQAVIRLAEAHAGDAAVRRRIGEVALAADADPRILFQSLLTIGGQSDEMSLELVHAAATGDALGDEWLRSGILSAAREVRASDLARLCVSYAQSPKNLGEGERLLVRQWAEQITAAGGDDGIRAALRLEPGHRELTRARLLGVADGLRHRGVTLRGWIARQPEEWHTWWREQLDIAAATVADESAPLESRRQELEVLALSQYESVAVDLAQLLRSGPRLELSLDVIRTIGSFDHPEAAELLVGGIAEGTPAERQTIFQALLAGRNGAEQLLVALGDGRLDVALVDAGSRQRLLGHPNERIRARAGQIIAVGSTGVEHVLTTYRRAVEQPGDPVRGREVFTRHCAACHRVGSVGTAVGPDVADNYNRTREQLLVAIIDPNRALESSYEAYVVVTKSGRLLQGLLAGETAAAVTLQEGDGKSSTIPRGEIEELLPTGQSFMPMGMERDIDVQAMGDLLTFLKEWRSLR